MTDLHDLLDRESRRVEPDPDAYRSVLRRTGLRRRRRRTAGIASAIVLVIGAGVGYQTIHETKTTTLATARSTTTATLAATTPQVVGRIDIAVDGGVTDVAVGEDGDAWVPGQDVVRRLDARTGTLKATIPVRGGSDYRYVAVGAGAVWVSDTGTTEITRIDPATNTVVATIATGMTPTSLVVGFDTVWFIDSGTSVVAIDPRTNVLGPRISVRGYQLAVGADEVFASGDHDVYAIDPVTHDVRVISRPLGSQTVALWGSGQALWALADTRLQQVDPITLASIGPSVDIRPGPLAVSTEALWLLQQPDSNQPSQLQQIDPHQATMVGAPIAVGVTAVAVAATDTTVWVANFNNGTVTRLALN